MPGAINYAALSVTCPCFVVSTVPFVPAATVVQEYQQQRSPDAAGGGAPTPHLPGTVVSVVQALTDRQPVWTERIKRMASGNAPDADTTLPSRQAAHERGVC